MRCRVDVITEQRCLSLLHGLIAGMGWSLDEQQRAMYVQMALRCLPVHSTDKQVQAFFANVYADYDTVLSLQQPLHPLHEQRWRDWSTRVILILRHRNLAWARDVAVSEEDLAQIAREELLMSLGDFCYRSRFSTWAYYVVTRAAQRCIRDLSAKKRTGKSEHLATVYEQALMVPDDDLTDLLAIGTVIYAEVEQVLLKRLGPQTAEVFRLFVREDMTAQAIADRFQLSLSRVQSLLREAKRVLRGHPDILLWREYGQDYMPD